MLTGLTSHGPICINQCRFVSRAEIDRSIYLSKNPKHRGREEEEGGGGGGSGLLMESYRNLLDDALVNVSNQPRRVILIEDRVETSGAFVLHQLMKRALSVETSDVVIFVALAETFSHYDRILRKLGCNLVARKQNNRLVFLDMLKLDCPDGGDRGDVVGGGLVDLYRKIRTAVEVVAVPEHERRCITIMIDDMSLLEVAAKGSTNYVLDFLHYCRTLTSEAGCSLVMLNHDDIYSSTTGPTLILHMEYLADIVIRAEPLSTGLATDVHGQLTVLNKKIVDELESSRSKIHNFHFKVKENSVEYFYPGTQI